MERHIWIFRHAKSSWTNAGVLDDIDRTLTPRGVQDAYTMGERLLASGKLPSCILTSPANRALHTAAIIAKTINFKYENLLLEASLYHASAEELMRVLQSFPKECTHIAIFAHNPGITDFAWQSGEEILNVSTCGVLHYKTELESWSDLNFSKLKFLSYDSPKKLL